MSWHCMLSGFRERDQNEVYDVEKLEDRPIKPRRTPEKKTATIRSAMHKEALLEWEGSTLHIHKRTTNENSHSLGM